MGTDKLGNVCATKRNYEKQYEAERCKGTLEKETGKPHKLVEWGMCYEEGVVCMPTWWQIAEFEECFDGAMFDDWIEYTNNIRASECAMSLNNIEGGHSYRAELALQNLIFRDSYRTTCTATSPESSALTKLTSFISRALSNVF
jgi:hypothetical protein